MPEAEVTKTTLSLRRVIDAPVEEVFEAFLDPEAVAAWYNPGGGMTTEVETWEPRPGGELDITMVADPEMELEADDPGKYRSTGTFREVVENERIVHTMSWIGGPDWRDSLVTVEFKEVLDGTEILLVHAELPDREAVESATSGWRGCLESLAEHL